MRRAFRFSIGLITKHSWITKYRRKTINDNIMSELKYVVSTVFELVSAPGSKKFEC